MTRQVTGRGCYRVTLLVDGEQRAPVIAAGDADDAVARALGIGQDLAARPLPWTSAWPNGRSSLKDRPPVVIVMGSAFLHDDGFHRLRRQIVTVAA